MTAWLIEIPNWHPVRINVWAGRHWRTKARLVQDQVAVIMVYARRAGVPDATGRRSVALHLEGWRSGGNFPDADAFDKLLLDALVRSRMLTDDDAAGILGRVAVTFARGAKRTIIRLEEMP